MARYGLNVSDVQNVIAIAVGGLPTGLIYEGDRRFNLVVRLPEYLRGNIDALKRLPIQLPNAVLNVQPNAPAAAAAYLTLGDVVYFDVIEGPNQISRENGKRRVVVSANVRGSDLGSFVREAQARVASEVHIPPGYWVAWGGQYEQLVSATERLTIVVPIALGLIFMLLYLMFGNLRDGLLVFMGCRSRFPAVFWRSGCVIFHSQFLRQWVLLRCQESLY